MASPINQDEISGTRALMRIAMALPLVERSYAVIRFLILRVKLLAVMDLLLPAEGRILDVGCGFGLWSAYFGQMQPQRRILGVDLSERRVEMARRVVKHVGVGAEFTAGDIREARVEGPFDGAYVLDVLHHIPRDDQRAVLEKLRDLLAPGGVLLIKDITTEPWLGLKFTEILDRAMVGFHEELAYRHHREWQSLLEELGFHVRVVRVPDVLPYPHVILAARKNHQ
jgi:2-polyprenyl-3-methyl-5-hydroxy-6-metoxy-1,4-benzoquinol methylase